MAAISTIRSNGWLLIVLLGLALAGFILMDSVSNFQNYSSADANTYGKVNGAEISRQDFDRYRDVIWANATGDQNQVNAQIWKFFTEKALVNEIAEGAGLGVQKDEMDDLQYGNNLSPIMQQRYSDPNTRQVNRQLLENVKNQIASGEFSDPRNRLYWAEQQKEIIKERLQSKITNLVSKAVYTPTWLASRTFKEGNQRQDFAFVRIPFDKVPASEVSLSDADYTSYLSKNQQKYWQDEEQRVLDYVVFDVIPSPADSALSRKTVSDMITRLQNAENDSAFVTSAKGGVYDEAYKMKNELPATIADMLFDAPAGSVVGPYLDGGSYSIAKIIDKKTIADSARARHILIKPENEGGVAQAEAKVDSLIQVLNSGAASFADLAARFGTDGTAQKGGDLGFFTPQQMVKEFSNVAFYSGKQNQPTKVATQFGWHVIEVTGRKFINNNQGIKVAFINDRVVPSKETQNVFDNKATDLMNKADNLEELAAAAAEANMAVQKTPALKASDFTIQQLGTGQDVRNMVLWAFKDETDVDDIHKNLFVFGDEAGGYFDSKYVVAGLSNVIEEGAPQLANVKSAIETDVLNAKKAAYLSGKLASGTALSTVAAEYGVAIDTARNATLQAANLPGAGTEPAVFGAVFSAGAGSVVGPIVGRNGVYMAQAAPSGTAPAAPADLTQYRRQAASRVQGQVRSRLIPSMLTDAEVEDARAALGF